jgi:hypothetical protein
MRFQLRATITLRSLSCTLPGNLQGRYLRSSFYTDKNTLKFINYLLLSICSDPNLHFVESPALAPPEVQIDLAAQQK